MRSTVEGAPPLTLAHDAENHPLKIVENFFRRYAHRSEPKVHQREIPMPVALRPVAPVVRLPVNLVKTAPVQKARFLGNVDNDFGSVDAFGRLLFTHGLLPFELSSALLMVAIVGAVAVARGRGKSPSHLAQPEKEETPAEQAPARPMEPPAYP